MNYCEIRVRKGGDLCNVFTMHTTYTHTHTLHTHIHTHYVHTPTHPTTTHAHTHTHMQQLPVNTNLFDTFGNHTHGMGSGGGASPIVMSQISASCPANMKEDGMVTPGEYGMGTDLDGKCRVACSQTLSSSIFSATHLTFEPRKVTSCILDL